MDLGLEGKVAIVTGGARNIGAAIVRGLNREGAHVVIADLLGATARELAASLDRPECRVAVVEADVRLAADMQRMAAATMKQFGRIEVLVNNAAVVSDFPLLEIAEDEWDRINDTNVKGIYLASQAVLPHMIAAGHGRIVNISSRSGKEGQATMPHYAASKFAVVGLSQSMAKELAPRGIHVNTVCPGILRTAMWESILDARSARYGLPREQVWEEAMQWIPLRRPQTPEDIASAVLFLSSDLVAGNITGEALSVNGGLRMD